jgi:hypothetical protein
MTRIAVGVVVCLMLASSALAQNVHFVKGPVATDVGTQLALTGKLAGLGEGDITVLVDAVGVAEIECRNPGGNVAPGQDTAISASGSVTLPSAKNGQLVFTVLTLAPVVPNTPTCPNSQWTAEVVDVAFSGGSVTVFQGGVQVLSQAFGAPE